MTTYDDITFDDDGTISVNGVELPESRAATDRTQQVADAIIDEYMHEVRVDAQEYLLQADDTEVRVVYGYQADIAIDEGSPLQFTPDELVAYVAARRTT